jgi:hypothetical protein
VVVVERRTESPLVAVFSEHETGGGTTVVPLRSRDEEDIRRAIRVYARFFGVVPGEEDDADAWAEVRKLAEGNLRCYAHIHRLPADLRRQTDLEWEFPGARVVVRDITAERWAAIISRADRESMPVVELEWLAPGEPEPPGSYHPEWVKEPETGYALLWLG